MNRWTSTAVVALVLAAGISAFTFGTNGGRAWTAESARRLAAMESPQHLPRAEITTQSGQVADLNDYTQGLVLMDFIYTRCPTVCLAMGAELRQWQSDLRKGGAYEEVRLLSLSFDRRDSALDLQQYLKRFAADPTMWAAARFTDQQVLAQLMDQLGVIAIPDPVVGFVHNAAIYLVDEGRVVGIFDYDDRSALRSALQQRMSRS